MTVKCQNALDVKIVQVKVFQWVARRGLSIGEHLAKDAAAVSHQDRGVHMLLHISSSQISLGKTSLQKDGHIGQRMVYILYYLRWGQA